MAASKTALVLGATGFAALGFSTPTNGAAAEDEEPSLDATPDPSPVGDDA